MLAFVHQTGGFGSPRHLYAQKISSAGALLWDATHVAVFDGGSLQFGNFPTFVADGSGGAVFAWYSSSPALEVFAQRVLANGAKAFGASGVAASTNAAQLGFREIETGQDGCDLGAEVEVEARRRIWSY